MRRRNKIKDLIGTLLLFGAMAVGSAWLAKQNEISLQGSYKIIDGDSLVVKGQEIRLLGIDAPEYRQICNLKDGSEYFCGKKSRSHLVKLAKAGKLTCTGSDEDKYQRLLAVCRAGNIDINAQMISDGWAVSYGDYEKLEGQAKDSEKGVWQGGFDKPKTWRENAKEAHSIGWVSKFLPW